jgi:zinc-binding alcohol dehydrogenase family protein
MRAIAYTKPLPLIDAEALIDIDVDRPIAEGLDLLVEIHAVSVNPVDVKRRARDDPGGKPRILGYDGAGVVVEAGARTSLFRPGDEVYYAGSIARPGTNAQFHLVDERIVGRKPRNLSFAEAAALPLTTLTAWELLLQRIGARRGAGIDRRAILIIGGAGGVGSIAIQLARRLTALTVIATASRELTRAWCLSLGAHHVIDHSRPFGPQLEAIGLARVDIVVGLTASDRHLPQIAEIIAPQGHLGLIDDAKGFDFAAFKSKSASIHWEFMFTRPVFETPDILEQHRILNEAATLIEAGVLRSTLSEIIGPIDAAHLRRAHSIIESGRAQGKIVLDGFP